MDVNDVMLVQSTFEKVKPNGDVAAAIFYERLFEAVPEVRPLFKGDMDEQGRKLIATLAVVVGSLHSLQTIMPAVGMLARKHAEFGVKEEHYGPVGDALMFALEQRLGPWWTTPVAAAWRSAYAELSAHMIAEAYGKSGATH